MLIAVTGMHREAILFPKGIELVVSGGDNSGLAAMLEAAIARGGRAVISVGICGGLAPELPIGAAVIASEAVWQNERIPTDARWREALATRLPRAISGGVAGIDSIVTEPAAKAVLHRETGAAAVDMETHIAARVAADHRLPFAALRVISDAATDTLPPAVLHAIGPDGKVRHAAMLRAIAVQPTQIPALIRTGRNSDRAMKTLLRCFDLLGIGFGCPYVG